MPHTLRLDLLGDFRIAYGDQILTSVSSPRLQALLAYLVLHRHTPQPRRYLAFQLWPDSSEEQARTNLRKLLHMLRKGLPKADRFLYIDGQMLQWRLDAPFALDVADFENAVTQADSAASLREAVDLYAGELFPDCYDDWIMPERERLRERFVEALERLIRLLEDQQDYRGAIRYAERLLRNDPLREETYRQLMRLHAQSGDRAGVLRVYQTCVNVLKRELDVEVSATTRAVFEQLVKMEITPTPSNELLPRARSNNLPIQLTSFIGREKQIADLRQLLLLRSNSRPRTRLLTTTGAGGCGKTRLALKVGSSLVESFKDGVWLVELASLSDPMLVPQVVAKVLNVREQQGRSLVEMLASFLESREILLILDNCEHLLDACARLVEALLHACPHLQFLATSRERLNIPGETIWLVPPLSLPDAKYLEQLEYLRRSEAVRLFVERAALVLPTFELNRQNASAVVQICQRLDGIPLAIEMAAARVSVLTVEQIAGRLQDRFRLLVGGSRTALPKNQTLRATIDWSYDLLPEAEQILFRRLSVFSGRWTIEAAEEVCAGEGIEAYFVLDILTHLVNKSLVTAEDQSGEVCYHMLETLRQYAHEKLQASGELERIRDRHLEYFLKIAEDAEPTYTIAGQSVWQRRLNVDYDNFRSAREWSQLSDDPERELRLVGAFLWYWFFRFSVYVREEEQQWIEATLTRAEKRVPKNAAYARALFGAGMLALSQGDHLTARSKLEESVSIWRSIGKDGRRGLAYALDGLRSVMVQQGKHEAADKLAGESMAIFEELGDQFGLGWSLMLSGLRAYQSGKKDNARSLLERSLAIQREIRDLAGSASTLSALGDLASSQGDLASAALYYQEGLAIARQLSDTREVGMYISSSAWVAYQLGDYENAGSLWRESLSLWREVDDQLHTAWALNHLGDVARCESNYEVASNLYRESLEKFRAMGHKQGIAAMLHNLGYVALYQHDHNRAESLFKESLNLFREVDHRWSIGDALAGLAGVAGAQGKLKQAARLFGAAHVLHHNIDSGGSSLDPANKLEWERNIANLRAQMDETTFTALWEEGRMMTMEQAINDALS